MSIGAFVTALLGLFPVAWVLGIMGCVRVRARGTRGLWMAVVALVLAALQTLAAAAIVVFVVVAVRQAQVLPADVPERQEAHVWQLAAGNCLDQAPGGAQVDVVTVVPCADGHAAQVVAGGAIDTSSAWPGQNAADAQVARYCRAAEPRLADEGRLLALAPTRDGWQAGDPRWLCVALTKGR